MNRLGICEWCLPPVGPFSLVLAKEAGYEGIQLGDLGGAYLNFPLSNQRIQKEYMRMSEKTGIILQALHLHTLVREGTMKYPLDSPQGQKGTLSLRKGIEICSQMHIPTLVLSAFFASSLETQKEFDIFSTQLRYACDYAEKYGITIAFESVLSIDRILDMVRIVDSGLKICYDTVNPIRCHSGIPEYEIVQLGNALIDHFHIKDTTENLKQYCLIGTGCSNLPKITDAINRIHYSGWFISENYYFRSPIGDVADPLVQLKQDGDTLRKIFPPT